jgi:hypothetical protein
VSTTTTESTPTVYVLWHRQLGKGQRWRKAGRYATRTEALAAMKGSGDWHVAPLHDERLAGEDTKARQNAQVSSAG